MDSQTLDSSLIREEKKLTESNIASSGKRFANMLIDTLIIYVLFFVIIFLMMSGGGYYDETSGIRFTIYLVWIAYYSLMEFILGKTVGKMITGTKVVTVEGEKPDFKTAFLRSICRFIPFDQFTFFGSPAVGWHDKLASSRVVNDREP